MSVKIGVLNGSNFNRDSAFQAGLSNLLTEGVRKNFMYELEVTANQVDTGMCFIEVTRDAVTPSEVFLIPIVNTEPIVVDTSGSGYVIVRVDKDKVNDGTETNEDGSNVATIEVVTELPTEDPYLILAALTAGAITDSRVWSQLNEDALDNPVYYDEDTSGTDSYVISINGVKEYKDGQNYTFKPATTNTGPCTLNINGLGAKTIKKGATNDLDDGDITASSIVTVRYNADTDFMEMMNPPASILVLEKASQAEAEAGTDDNTYMTPLKTKQSIALNSKQPTTQVFTSNGTYTKPAGATAVLVEMWGGGGGGGSASSAAGGGGGAYNRKLFVSTEVGATENVVVGAGGARGSAGGVSSFGSLLYAYGGGQGTDVSGGSGGGGGGQSSRGTRTGYGGGPMGGIPGNPGTESLFGGAGGGEGASGSFRGGKSYYGGGGGGRYGGAGGDSVYGGGGGAGENGGPAGLSTYGGNGGTSNANGSIPGGGGGGEGAGARGEVRVTTFY